MKVFIGKPVKSIISKRLIQGLKVITCSVFPVLLLFPISTNQALSRYFFLPFEEDDDLRIRTVVIDPGHGGHDSGCLGHSNVNEKHIALKIGLFLGGYIEKYLPDVKVIYTRTKDVFVELEERAAIANRNQADLFISIHCNAASPAAFGAETYVMGLHKTEGNLNVAKRENSVMELEDNYMERYGFDFNSAESYIMLSLTQDAYLEQSTDFAARIQEQFRERVGRHDRGVKSAGFWVLWRTAMPSVLIETGFLTNAREERFLNSTQGQEYMASAIYRAFRDYKNDVEGDLAGLERIEATSAGTSADAVQSTTEIRDKSSFRVQLLVSSRKYDSFHDKFSGVDNLIIEQLDNGLYRYSAGPYGSREKAGIVLPDLAAKGFSDAFIAVYRAEGGREITRENDR